MKPTISAKTKQNTHHSLHTHHKKSRRKNLRPKGGIRFKKIIVFYLQNLIFLDSYKNIRWIFRGNFHAEILQINPIVGVGSVESAFSID